MTLSESILSTLAYHDIFDYPLTAGEISNYLIAQKARESLVEKELAQLVKSKKIGENRSFYFLKNRQKIVKLRLQRQKYSQEKLQRAKLFSKLLTLIPTIKLVAISGALAMQNSHQKDDIDLVLVTSKRTLWTTRFLANLLLLPYKRDPHGRKITDRACLNLLIDESRLEIEPKNLYFAHEIYQMKPLWDREATYSRFINANNWVKKFLPNWEPSYRQHAIGDKKSNLSLATCHLSLVENFLRNFQLWYMRSKITTEKIGEYQLFFHPKATQEWVLKEYQKRLKRLRITS